MKVGEYMNNQISNDIIMYLIRNRVSTTEVADALGKTGAVPNVMPVNRGHYVAGQVKWIYAYDESNWPIHEQIQDIEEGKVVLVEAFDCNRRALFGELVSKFLLLYKQSKAIVACGTMRDAAALIRNNFPVWCDGFNPIGCFNKKPENEYNSEVIDAHREKYDGSIAVCDDCGVVIIPKEKITEEFLQELYHIENQEDIWFDRLDHYKESTFDIVCKKKYLEDAVYMERRNQ